MGDSVAGKRKRYLRLSLAEVYMPPELKRDILRISKRENRSLSATCVGLLRLGLGRYFELADAKRAQPLLEKMRDFFNEGEEMPPIPERGTSPNSQRKWKTRDFDAAVEEGKARFEAAIR